MLETLNWLSIKQLISLRTLQLIHKMCKGNAPEYLNKIINKKSDTHNYNLRNKNDIKIKDLRRNNTYNTLTCTGFKLYNELPREVKEEKNDDIFKKKTTKWLKTNVPLNS